MTDDQIAAYEKPTGRLHGLDTGITEKAFKDTEKLQCSIRHLESIAHHLRKSGSRVAADKIDIRIMSILEKKIYKKAVAKRN